MAHLKQLLDVPSRGPDPAHCPQELAARSLQKQKAKSRGAGQGLPARRLPESWGTPNQQELGGKQGPGMRRWLHSRGCKKDQQVSLQI